MEEAESGNSVDTAFSEVGVGVKVAVGSAVGVEEAVVVFVGWGGLDVAEGVGGFRRPGDENRIAITNRPVVRLPMNKPRDRCWSVVRMRMPAACRASSFLKASPAEFLKIRSTAREHGDLNLSTGEP